MKRRIASILESWGLPLTRASQTTSGTEAGRRLHVLLRLDDELVLVGTLSQESDLFVFQYADDFIRRGLPPISGFPRLTTERYTSDVLWPFFQVRLPPATRADVARVLKDKHVDTNDVFEMLRVLGRRTLTSPYELELAS